MADLPISGLDSLPTPPDSTTLFAVTHEGATYKGTLGEVLEYIGKSLDPVTGVTQLGSDVTFSFFDPDTPDVTLTIEQGSGTATGGFLKVPGTQPLSIAELTAATVADTDELIVSKGVGTERKVTVADLLALVDVGDVEPIQTLTLNGVRVTYQGDTPQIMKQPGEVSVAANGTVLSISVKLNPGDRDPQSSQYVVKLTGLPDTQVPGVLADNWVYTGSRYAKNFDRAFMEEVDAGATRTIVVTYPDLYQGTNDTHRLNIKFT